MYYTDFQMESFQMYSGMQISFLRKFSNIFMDIANKFFISECTVVLEIEIILKLRCIIFFYKFYEMLTIFHALTEIFYNLGTVVRFSKCKIKVRFEFSEEIKLRAKHFLRD